MEVLTKLIFNTFKILVKKRSFILIGIILPALITIFFSFEFGGEYSYKVGIIDNDDSYISREIIKSIENLEEIDCVEVREDNYKVDLITQQVQVVIIINKGLEDKLINLENEEIIIKSISDSDIKAIIESMIKLKLEDFTLISQLSDKNIKRFIELNEDYNDIPTQLSLNDIDEERANIENSLGIIIMVTFILGGNLANYLIEDEENNTKTRIISSGISEVKYYLSMITVFYILSCITSLIYYSICKLFNIDFGMNNTISFLILLFILNLLSISFNLFIVSFSKSRYITNIINILIIVPSCMISGVFWDFNIMPNYLQELGSITPIRWVYICIEELQNNNNLLDIKTYISAMLIISIILFIASIIRFKYIRKVKL